MVVGTLAEVFASDLFDPSSDTWMASSPMDERRHAHTSTTLADGKVIVAGGNTTNEDGDRTLSNTAEIFEP